MISLPMGMRAGFEVYLISDSSGIDTVISASGGKTISDENMSPFVDASIAAANEMTDLEDFRPMSDDEVTEYLAKQEKEEADTLADEYLNMDDHYVACNYGDEDT